jgi:methylthioribose-1-phosphate isomerase
MKVRGAPAIAIAGMLAVAQHALNLERAGEFASKSSKDAAEWFVGQLDSLKSSRPTAVNLFQAIDSFTALVNKVWGMTVYLYAIPNC